MAIVSGVPHNRYGDDEGLTPGFEVLRTHGDGSRNSLGIRLARALLRDGMAVVFGDAAPYSMQKDPMDTVEVRILDRAARIHDGVFRMGSRLRATLLPYCLTFERGRFGVVVFDPVPLDAVDAPQQLADCIGRALQSHYESNLFAGYPTLYGFAPRAGADTMASRLRGGAGRVVWSGPPGAQKKAGPKARPIRRTRLFRA